MAQAIADALEKTTDIEALERERNGWSAAGVTFCFLSILMLGSSCVIAAIKGNVEIALLAGGALMVFMSFLTVRLLDILKKEIEEAKSKAEASPPR